MIHAFCLEKNWNLSAGSSHKTGLHSGSVLNLDLDINTPAFPETIWLSETRAAFCLMHSAPQMFGAERRCRASWPFGHTQFSGLASEPSDIILHMEVPTRVERVTFGLQPNALPSWPRDHVRIYLSQIYFTLKLTVRMAPGHGYDPRPPGSKPGVLPLHQSGIFFHAKNRTNSQPPLTRKQYDASPNPALYMYLAEQERFERSRTMLCLPP